MTALTLRRPPWTPSILQDSDVVEAALAHFVARPALGFTDCLVLEIARKAAIPAALDQRALTGEEASRFRDFSSAEIEVDREADHHSPSDEAPPPWRPWWQLWK